MPFKVPVKVLTFDPFPPGEYQIEVVDVTEKESTKAGDYLLLQLKVVGGEYDNRRLLQGLFNHTEGAQAYTTGILMSLGFDLEDGEEIEIEPEDLIGQTARVLVGIQEGNVNEETGEEYDAKNVVEKWYRN